MAADPIEERLAGLEAAFGQLCAIVSTLARDLYGPGEVLEADARKEGREDVLSAIEELAAAHLPPPQTST